MYVYRKKSYSVTQKGVVLLYLLKEALTTAFTQMHKNQQVKDSQHFSSHEFDLNDEEMGRHFKKALEEMENNS